MIKKKKIFRFVLPTPKLDQNVLITEFSFLTKSSVQPSMPGLYQDW